MFEKSPMFEYINQPWKETGAPISILIHSLGKDQSKINTYINVNPNSIIFTKETIDFDSVLLQKNLKKYIHSVRFPIRYVKYFEIEKFFANSKDELPTTYKLHFYVQLD